MRIVVKIGTSTLAHATGKINLRRVEELCRTMSDLKNAGHEIILVSSGAIGMGAGKLGLRSRPSDIPSKQAAAAVGQCELMYVYDKLFGEYGHTVAQILLTGEDIEDDTRRTNFRNTLFRLLEFGALPVVNENDTVATKEIVIGDNDTLSAVVAVNAEADLLILLSDVDGLYTGDPRTHEDAEFLSEVKVLTPEILSLGEGEGSALGTAACAPNFTRRKQRRLRESIWSSPTVPVHPCFTILWKGAPAAQNFRGGGKRYENDARDLAGSEIGKNGCGDALLREKEPSIVRHGGCADFRYPPHTCGKSSGRFRFPAFRRP